MHTNTDGGPDLRSTLPFSLSRMLDHHVAQLREHPRYEQVWWDCRGAGEAGVYLTLRVKSAVETLTQDDRLALERLQIAVSARHPELVAKGRLWSTDRDEMAVTWHYLAEP